MGDVRYISTYLLTFFLLTYLLALLYLNRISIRLSFIVVTLCLIVGWEYTVDTTVSSYVAVEKTYHMSRRRRWVRSRNLVKSAEKEDKARLQPPCLRNISNTSDSVSSDIQTPRRELKVRRTAE